MVEILQYVVWAISFISIYICLIWLNLFYIDESDKKNNLKKFPRITIAIPAYNEEGTIKKTLNSVLLSNYPGDKMEIIVIDDGSTDNTAEIVQSIIKKNPDVNLIKQKNKGKAAALNNTLRHAKGELFACIDADSRINKKAFRTMVRNFENPKIAAVVSPIKTINQRNLYEKIQRVEYFVAILIRKMMASLGTLAQTPGALSIYQTVLIKKFGGFDEASMTEDFEMAMRLKYNGYDIKTESEAVTLTHVPKSFKGFLKQRERWYRGFIVTHLKYKKMFFNRRYGLMGFFQLPVNILGFAMVTLAISLIIYYAVSKLIEIIIRILTIDGYLGEYIFHLPTLKEFVLSHNAKIMLPIYVGSLIGAYFIYCAHKNAKERFRNFSAILAYMFIYPYLTAIHWFSAITKEISGVRRRW